ncbi:MAG: hypothetical protein CMF63_09170 [Magnetovibrio sp.]|nr:hypothetical protein [Magnetovibrio sp.]
MSKHSNDRIPFVDLAKQFSLIKNDVMPAIGSVAEEAAFIRGPALTDFEERFADLHNIKHAIGVASGTDALSISVRTLEIGPGDEVVTVPNTWISTAFAISHAGATPVFVEINPDTHQMDPAALEKALTPRTKAVIPVHLFGHPAPMSDIGPICQRRGIKIVEDVAQAPLAREQGRLAGTLGDMACFSFYPSKNLGAYGDGGLILTDNDDLAATALRFSNYGQNGTIMSGVHDTVGYNSRLDSLQAAILLRKLPYLGEWTEARRRAAARYDELLEPLPVKCPIAAPGAEPVHHLYVVQIDNRDACHAYLRENGVMAQLHYPIPLHLQKCYRNLGYKEGDLPTSEGVNRRVLSLPIYPEIADGQIKRVVDVLARFIESGS